MLRPFMFLVLPSYFFQTSPVYLRGQENVLHLLINWTINFVIFFKFAYCSLTNYIFEDWPMMYFNCYRWSVANKFIVKHKLLNT